MENYKGSLQEFTMKAGLGLPAYETKAKLINNTITWTSVVHLDGNKGQIAAEQVGGGIRKKDVEQLAAKKLLKKLTSSYGSVEAGGEREIVEVLDTVVLIDLDNSSRDIELLIGRTVVGFAGKMFTKDIPEFVKVFVAKLAVKDMADHMMTFFAGANVSWLRKEDKEVAIITSDGFGECLSELLVEQGVRAKHFTSIRSFLGVNESNKYDFTSNELSLPMLTNYLGGGNQ